MDRIQRNEDVTVSNYQVDHNKIVNVIQVVTYALISYFRIRVSDHYVPGGSSRDPSCDMRG